MPMPPIKQRTADESVASDLRVRIAHAAENLSTPRVLQDAGTKRKRSQRKWALG